ncbi:MAG: ribosome small subunit-dependent GTPase A [Clostridia bacterium]|nr:ribosome small subunit-dependent GTPase A [Clostridia bacterium]
MGAGRTGTILKGVGGLYTVYSSGETFECRLRGSIRLEGIRPVTGDNVVLETEPGSSVPSVIGSVLPRRNVLVRPRAANIDQIVLVIASLSPAPDLFLVDKLLIAAGVAGTGAVLVINKADQDEAAAADIAEQYKGAAQCIITKALDSDDHGLEPLLAALKGRTSVLAGQSGVGKSTILNMLTDGAYMATGSISEKTLRGRHTTRHAELFPISGKYADEPSFIIDSPGFSLLELEDIAPRDLSAYYPEVYNHEGECRFQDCSHTGEPGCFVPGLVETGAFHPERYERYKVLYRELETREKNKYKNKRGL